MPIRFRKMLRKVLAGDDKDMMKTYAVAKASYVCDMAKLSELVAARTAMSDSEVTGMLKALSWVIRSEMAYGAIIQLPDVGRLRYSIISEGAIDADDFNVHLIKGVRIVFTPSVALKEAASRVRFMQDDVKIVKETEECKQEHVP